MSGPGTAGYQAMTDNSRCEAPSASTVPVPLILEPQSMATTKTNPTSRRKPPAGGNAAGSSGSQPSIVPTEDFDLEWLAGQREALLAERAGLTGQAIRLEDEAQALLNDGEMGDARFDDEGGEGDGMAVERDRDLMLSAQARETVREIDAALERMTTGTYGYSAVSGRPIPHDRLEAIPWATLLVEEKRGGIGNW